MTHERKTARQRANPGQSDIFASTEITIPFHDVDMMRIAWHGHYAKYLEIARCELLDLLGYNYQAMSDSGYGWPIIEMNLRYAQPLRFQQTILVTANLVEWTHRLKLNYIIQDKLTGKRLTRAYTVQVPVDLTTNQLEFECPPILENKIQALLAQHEKTS